MEYIEKRKMTRNFLLKILEKHGVTSCNLKGSWEADDFHLSLEGNISYSDIDIFIKGIDGIRRDILVQKISHDLARCFDNPIAVSIHSLNSLYQMNIFDAQMLGIAEYIAQYRRLKTNPFYSKGYIDAKFTLLLLRNSFDERYQDVAKRIGTLEAERAIDVKLGKEKTFPHEYAKSLIHEHGTTVAVHFLNKCLLDEPDDNTANSTLEKLSRCETIDRWLYGYLVNKVKRYSV